MSAPGYNGCPFANANAEAASDGVEASALRRHRTWLTDLLLSLARDAGCTDPDGVVATLRLVYDGAIAGSHLDGHSNAVGLAREVAENVLVNSLRAAPGSHAVSPNDQSTSPEAAGARG